MSTEVWGSSQRVVNWMSSKCIKEGSGLVKPIWAVCLDEIVKCVACAEIEEKRN